MKRVVCFGEILLRLSPPMGGRWLREAAMPVYAGGAELNVAQALARWNVPVKYVTCMPGNALTQELLQQLQEADINVSDVRLAGSRLGIYYLPQGADLKSSGVIYDRAGSAFAELQPGQLDWNTILEGYDWFHFSAICPALNATAAAVCKEAVEAAAARGMTVSVDLNYRSKLWQYGVPPVTVMQTLLPHCTVIMGNIWAAEILAGIASPIQNSSGHGKQALAEAAGTTMLALHQRYPNATTFACTFRLDTEYFAVLQQGPQMAVSSTFALQQVVDKAGSGDCFMAGLIYGITSGLAPRQTVNFAASAAAGKLAETGDATSQTIEQILSRAAHEPA